MKNNLRDKFRDFLASEQGRVGVKAPLAVGIASGSLLLAQAMSPTDAQAHFNCFWDFDCDEGEVCLFWCDDWSPFVNMCMGDWHSECVGH
jgi:hypothetical protein